MNSTRRWDAHSGPLLAMVAAFCTYFCMYAFRKPFAAAEYAGLTAFGFDYKILAVLVQVLGYALSKCAGIKVVSQMPPRLRIAAILGLILWAELALLAFALIPRPWNLAGLFLNGLPLGMIWGIVFSFLEGRKNTELLGAGLCSSFILASGVMKSIGDWLVGLGVSQFWMPALAGALFIVPLCASLALLARTPPPSAADRAERASRPPMTGSDRRTFLARHWGLILLLVAAYTVLNAYRDFRDNFGKELWTSVGFTGEPEIFTLAEIPSAFVAFAISAMLVLVRDNRRALRTSLATLPLGALLIGLPTLGFAMGGVGPVPWLILVGVGAYVPYIAFHVAIYERLLALLREPANIAFLMYLSDATGYIGAVSILVYKDFGAPDLSWQKFFIAISLGAALVVTGLFALVIWLLRWQTRRATAAARVRS